MEIVIATPNILQVPEMRDWPTARGEVASIALGLAKGLRSVGHNVTLFSTSAPDNLTLVRRLSLLSFACGPETCSFSTAEARLASGVDIAVANIPANVPSPIGTPLALTAWLADRAILEPLVFSIGDSMGFVPLLMRDAYPRQVFVPIDPGVDTTFSSAVPGLPASEFHAEGFEFYGAASATKAGLVYATRFAFLGQKHLDSWEDESARWSGVLRARRKNQVVADGGADVAVFNPSVDPHLSHRYDSEDLTGKTQHRANWSRDLELDIDLSAPLLWVPYYQHSPALEPVLSTALRAGWQMVISGPATSPPDALIELAAAFRGRLALRFPADEAFHHRALGAADFTLFAQGHDVSGLRARAAIRYGAIPLCISTPGSLDAVVDIDPEMQSGTGFIELTSGPNSIVRLLQRAMVAYRHADFGKVIRRCLRLELGWDRVARRLASLF